MQRARCYLLGETAVVLELEPPVTLESQKRIWGLTQRLTDREEVVEVIPGMNNITVVLRRPQEMAWEAIDKLQRWWEESDALEPESREISIPVIYGGEAGPDLGDVARHSGLSEKQVVDSTLRWSIWCGFWVSSRGFRILAACRSSWRCRVRAAARTGTGGIRRYQAIANRYLSAGDAGRLAAAGAHAAGIIRSKT